MNAKSIFKILLIILLLFSNNLWANPKDSVSVNIKNKPLKKLLKVIENQTEFTFVYSNSEIDVNRKISVNVQNSNLISLLENIFVPLKIEYKIIGKQIVLKKTIETSSNSQFIEINGLVRGKIDSIPIPGVNVYIKGLSLGTTTDIDGTFQLNIPGKYNTLVFSFIGYKKTEVNINKKTYFQVLLEEDKLLIDEVVVIGYGKESKKLLSSAVSDIKYESINESITSNISESIKGKLSGIQINQNSGTPGAAISAKIRGISSITAGSDPLYIIDGVPVITTHLGQIAFSGQELSTTFNINPADIESISILKDASASAIYGARGSNGVILITTKRGKSGKSSLRFNAKYGLQQVANTYHMLNAEQFMNYKNEAAINDGGVPVYTEEEIRSNKIDNDWQKELYKISPIQNYNLDITGGSDKTRYYLILSYFDQEGIAIGTDYERLSGRINLDHKFSNKLDIGAGLAITRSINNRKEGDQSLNGPVPNAIELPPIYPVYNQDGSYNDDGPFANPISIANQHINVAYMWSNQGNFFANYKIYENLDYKFKLGINYVNLREHSYDPPTTRQGAKYQGYGEEATSEDIKTLLSNILNYSIFFKENHRIDLLIGQEIDKEQISFTYMRGELFPNEKLDYLVSSAKKVSADADFRESVINSYFGRAKYNFKNKYLLTLNARYDGSSRFSNKNKYGFFPSGDIAWRISEEPFFNIKIINDLKIRTSYGVTGNDKIPDFLYLQKFGTAEYAGSSVIYPENIANPDLKWETTKQFNLGIDISLINDRIVLNADYYKKKTEDLLLTKPNPISSGFKETISNIGKLENEGFEISLETINLKKSVIWTSQLNVSTNKNTVTQLYSNQSIDNIGRGYQRIEVGEPIGIFYGYNSLGVDQSTGDLIFEDVNKDGIIDVNDKKKIGCPHALFQGGFSNNITYKNFSLNIFLQFSYGNDVFNGTRRYIEAMKGIDNQMTSILDRWQEPGDVTEIPRATNLDPNENNRVSSRFVEDGSYLKIKSVKLSYKLNAKFINRLNINNISIFINAQNLYTFTNYSGMDPEVNYDGSSMVKSGVEFFTYPSAKILSFGLNIEF